MKTTMRIAAVAALSLALTFCAEPSPRETVEDPVIKDAKVGNWGPAAEGVWTDDAAMELADESVELEELDGIGYVGGAGGGFGGVASDSREPSDPAPGAFGRESFEEPEENPRFGGVAADGAKKDEARRRKKRKTWKRSSREPNASMLQIGDDEELALDGMQATIRVDGFRARIVLDCFYTNHLDRQLEGTFKLRLPDDASPYFFAFGESKWETKTTESKAPDIQAMFVAGPAAARTEPGGILSARSDRWTDVKESRMVPREKAAHAYFEETRRRIDPALMEWSGAGIFQSRVFPLQPKKLHRIVIGYEVNLLPVGDDLVLRFDLPSGIPERAVTITGAGAFAVSPPRKTSKRTYHFAQPKARTFTVTRRRAATLLVGKDEATGAHFAASFTPPLPEVETKGADRAVFLVDTSLSSNPERMNVWLKLVEAVLEKNRADLRHFNVLFFDVQHHWWRNAFIRNTTGNVKLFLADAKDLALEGATDLGAALEQAATPSGMKKMPAEWTWDAFLLSDGASTWGADSAQELLARFQGGKARTLFAYRTGFSGTDQAMLSQLTRATGGAVFSVVGDAEIDAAATAHRKRPWLLEGVKVAGATDMLLAGRPTALHPGQTLYLAGRGTPDAKAPIELTVSQGDDRRTVRVVPAVSIESDLAPRVYGQIAVGQLEEFGSACEDAAKAYATHFRVVGKTCSLLMLESEEAYERYGIRPEEDAFVVGKTPASTVVARILEEGRGELADAKSATLGWIKRLSKAPGVTFALPQAAQLALEQLPVESFHVRPAPMDCKARGWDDVPGAYQESLASRKLSYDAVTAEAERRRTKYGAADALRTLSSLIENEPGNAPVARDVAFSAQEWGLGGQAFHLFRRVARARPYEPQTYWQMARCLEAMGRTDLAAVHYEVVLSGTWDPRFGEFRRIATFDYLRMLRGVKTEASRIPDFLAARRATLTKEIGVDAADLVFTIAWNTDRTDVDLHVTDPSGEVCFYSHRDTKQGGHITQDVTQGYGPEMFTLKDPAPGTYVIQVKYFAADETRSSLRSKVSATLFADWGADGGQVSRKVVILRKGKEFHEIGRVVVPPAE